MKKKWKYLVGIILVLALLLLIISRILKPKEEIETKALPTVTTEKLKKADVRQELSLIGTIAPSDTYYVMPKLSGEILEIYVENGQPIRAGEPIARLDNQKQIDAARFQMEQAGAQNTTAQAALQRMQSLLSSGDISHQDYEQARASAEAAQAGYKSAKLNYDTQREFATVTAPADGIVQNVDMSRNTVVSQQSRLCIITGAGAKTISFHVTDDVMQKLQVGTPVTVEKDGASFTGEITEVGAVLNQQTGLYPVKASLNDASRLPDGASAKLTLTVAEVKDSYVLPLSDINYEEDNPFVYLYQEGKAVKREVGLGIESSTEAQLLEGLDGSEDIISSWSKSIYDGAEVQLAGSADAEASSESTQGTKPGKEDLSGGESPEAGASAAN